MAKLENVTLFDLICLLGRIRKAVFDGTAAVEIPSEGLERQDFCWKHTDVPYDAVGIWYHRVDGKDRIIFLEKDGSVTLGVWEPSSPGDNFAPEWREVLTSEAFLQRCAEADA